MPRKSERIDHAIDAIRAGVDERQTALRTSMPAIVQSVDFGSYSLSLQPAIQGSMTLPSGERQTTTLPILADVPVVIPRGGGFALTFPLRAGDQALVSFSDRCIDTWWQSGGVAPPAEERMHDLSDGLAIPGPVTPAHPISGISSERVELRDDAGTSLVAIDRDGHIEMQGAETATLRDESGDNAVEVSASGTVSTTAETEITSAAPTITLTAETMITLQAPTIQLLGQVSSASISSLADNLSGVQSTLDSLDIDLLRQAMTTTYNRDIDGRLVQIDETLFPGGPETRTTTYVYDIDGALTGVVVAIGEYLYTTTYIYAAGVLTGMMKIKTPL